MCESSSSAQGQEQPVLPGGRGRDTLPEQSGSPPLYWGLRESGCKRVWGSAYAVTEHGRESRSQRGKIWVRDSRGLLCVTLACNSGACYSPSASGQIRRHPRAERTAARWERQKQLTPQPHHSHRGPDLPREGPRYKEVRATGRAPHSAERGSDWTGGTPRRAGQRAVPQLRGRRAPSYRPCRNGGAARR